MLRANDARKNAWQGLLICIVVLFACCLYGCNRHKNYPLNQNVGEIDYIDVVYVSTYEPVKIKEIYLQDNAVTIIPKERWEVFLNELSLLSYKLLSLDPYTDLGGYVIRIRYTDGTIDFISDRVGIFYDGSQTDHTYALFESDEFAAFVEKYIEVSQKTD